ncbi:MAG: sodium-dependent transporter [Clostridia bacterium]|nr:sodium-dependent transporter [Clostridia bacterium]
MTEKRGSFSGKLGFVMAAAGSAVGLGNIWRFPYLAAEHGGGIFLLVYLVLVLTFGYALMKAEIALGRKTGLSVIGAFKKLNKRWSFLGILAAIVPIVILPYYSVIGGWVCKYFATFVSGGMEQAAQPSFFGDFISQPFEPLGWFLLFLGLTALAVLLGVDKGVEKVSKIMMPVLIVLAIGIAIYSLTLPGAGDGLSYYLVPDFSQFSATTVLAAMGQMFYSMSLAMGIMITYGSYMKKDVNLESSVKQIEFFDTGIAFLAGVMVIVPIFSLGNMDQIKPGPGLMFQSLPMVFNNMGTVGNYVGTLFFVLVMFAALTSSISLMETVVSIFRDKFGWGRKVTCGVVLAICLVLGVPSSLGNGIWSGFQILPGQDFLTFCDFMTNSVLMPIVAFLMCIFVGYIIKPKTLIEEARIGMAEKHIKLYEGTNPVRRFFNSAHITLSRVSAPISHFRREPMFSAMIRYIAPVCIVLILLFSVLSAFDLLKYIGLSV